MIAHFYLFQISTSVMLIPGSVQLVFVSTLMDPIHAKVHPEHVRQGIAMIQPNEDVWVSYNQYAMLWLPWAILEIRGISHKETSIFSVKSFGIPSLEI